MKIKMYQVDAFTSRLFSGNPAAVCHLDKWLPDELMQSIAFENNLSETAFVCQSEIRWFTPTYEIDLCGHATLAAASVLMRGNEITFDSRSGPLHVRKKASLYELDFPLNRPKEIQAPSKLLEGLSITPQKVLKSFSYLVILDSEQEVREINMNNDVLRQLDLRGVIVSAPGDNCDVVSRCLFPGKVLEEDPVTGSAHTIITPYWAEVFNKSVLKCHQASDRGGSLECEVALDRVLIRGSTVKFFEGEIEVQGC